MSKATAQSPAKPRLFSDRPIYLPAAWLIVIASWWISAGDALRLFVLWVIALLILGRWGERRLEASHRSILAGLLGVGMLNVVIASNAGDSVVALGLRAMILTMALADLLPWPGAARSKAATPPPAVATRSVWLLAAFTLSVLAGAVFVWRPPTGRAAQISCGLIALAPLAYYLVFRSLVRDHWTLANRETAASCLLALPPIILIISAAQIGLLAGTWYAAGTPETIEEYQRALKWNAVSLKVNQWVQSRTVEDRLLVERARNLAWTARNEESLEVLLRQRRNHYFPPGEPRLRALCEAYLSTGTLEEQIVALSHPRYLWRFDELPLSDDMELRSLMLGSFVRNGLLDRFVVEYVQGRLTKALDIAHLHSSLTALRLRSEDPNQCAQMDYLLGILTTWLGGYDQAREHFLAVLKTWPDYHNALVWLDRLRDKGDTTSTLPAAYPPTGRIAHHQFLGNQRYNLNVDDALWTALESRPGRYELALQVKGQPADGEWPVLAVYVDGVLALEEPVRSDVWTTETCSIEFESDGSHRLVIGFQNDMYRETDGRLINRNLYFSHLAVRPVAAVEP